MLHETKVCAFVMTPCWNKLLNKVPPWKAHNMDVKSAYGYYRRQNKTYQIWTHQTSLLICGIIFQGGVFYSAFPQWQETNPDQKKSVLSFIPIK